MQKKIHKAKIALLTCSFETPKIKTKHSVMKFLFFLKKINPKILKSKKVEIAYPDEIKKLHRIEQNYFVNMIKRCKDSGVNFVSNPKSSLFKWKRGKILDNFIDCITVGIRWWSKPSVDASWPTISSLDRGSWPRVNRGLYRSTDHSKVRQQFPFAWSLINKNNQKRFQELSMDKLGGAKFVREISFGNSSDKVIYV